MPPPRKPKAAKTSGASRGGASPKERAWRKTADRVRAGESVPFDEQMAAFRAAAEARAPAEGPLPAWEPDPKAVASSNLGRAMRDLGFKRYPDFHAFSAAERARFWEDAIRRVAIPFRAPPKATVDLAKGPEHPVWLPGARLSAVDACFKPPPATIAIVRGREGSERLETLTYGELEAMADRVASALLASGFAPGMGVALYLPMTVECVAAYLGIVRAGCFAVSIADSFSPAEVRRRVEISGAAGIVTVDRFTRGGKAIGLYAKAAEAGAPRAIVIPEDPAHPPSLRAGDLLWEAFLSAGGPILPEGFDPDAVTNVLFSSGTTGDPKAIPWTHLTPIKCAVDGHYLQDIRPGDVVAWPTSIGWMMGPWLIYASLANGAAMALYEGAPTGDGFARFVERAKVTVLGVVPSLVRAWREGGALEKADWTGIRVFSSTGEASNVADYLWLMSRARYRAPVIEYCGGTEIGGGHIAGTVVQPASPATFTTPAPGLDFRILDEAGRPVKEGGMGELYLVPPSIGMSQTLLNKDHHAVYYEGCPAGPKGEILRRHGDQVLRLAKGFFKALGRADDTMNLGGIKVSSFELEQAIGTHPAVRESAAIAVQPGGEGADALVAYVVLKPPWAKAPPKAELQERISKALNPLFRLHDVVAVEKLPRTASNKLMRRELRAAYLERLKGGKPE